MKPPIEYRAKPGTKLVVTNRGSSVTIFRPEVARKSQAILSAENVAGARPAGKIKTDFKALKKRLSGILPKDEQDQFNAILDRYERERDGTAARVRAHRAKKAGK